MHKDAPLNISITLISDCWQTKKLISSHQAICPFHTKSENIYIIFVDVKVSLIRGDSENSGKLTPENNTKYTISQSICHEPYITSWLID